MPVTTKKYVELDFYGEAKIVIENGEGVNYEALGAFIKNPAKVGNKITIGKYVTVDLNMLEYHVQGIPLSEPNTWFACGSSNTLYRIPIHIPIVKVMETVGYFYHLGESL